MKSSARQRQDKRRQARIKTARTRQLPTFNSGPYDAAAGTVDTLRPTAGEGILNAVVEASHAGKNTRDDLARRSPPENVTPRAAQPGGGGDDGDDNDAGRMTNEPILMG